FVSLARSAAKSRQRQFEVRTLIEQTNESEERLQTALRVGRLGSWELDLDSLTLSGSATYKALFGRGPDDSFIYADLLASVHEDDREQMLAAVEAAVKTGQDYASELRAVWPDGSIHWVEIRARRVRDRRAAMRLVGVALDITERKSVETGLVALNETLEERVAERTRALEQAHKSVLAEIEQRQRAEAQLRQAQKLDMIGQLTGGVAHDFNNLLMAVLGNLELLQKHAAGDARAMRLIDGAIKGAERGASLTQRLLAFARRQDLQLKATSADDLVRDITGQYRAGAVKGQIVPGYDEELGPREDGDSATEPFVALKAHVDNWRWRGTPFYLRTGKRLPERVTEIVVQFKCVPHSIFADARMQPNRLVIGIQPEENITLSLMAKVPGLDRDGMTLRAVPLNIAMPDAFSGKDRRIAYERLLLDLIEGDQTLFVRRDEVEAQWTWIDAIRRQWADEGLEPKPYAAGSWGPSSAIALAERDGVSWHE
ncbi:MAG: PAS domain-containing protein, partial [Croceibacterium sp.]